MTEDRAARLLEDVLQDETLWEPRLRDHPELRSALADRAIQLYQSTSSSLILEDSQTDERFVQALWILRDVADRCAVLSKEWNRRELKQWENIPSLASIERSIRETGVDRWAAELDITLSLSNSDGSDDSQTAVGRLWHLKTSPRRVADEFAAADRTLRMILKLRNDKGVGWFQEHAKFPKGAASFVAGARNDLLWAAIMEDEGAVAVAQGAFVASHAPEMTAVFPTQPFIRDRLNRNGGRVWLSQHGRELPPWLTS
jgi:hypothetical protein